MTFPSWNVTRNISITQFKTWLVSFDQTTTIQRIWIKSIIVSIHFCFAEKNANNHLSETHASQLLLSHPSLVHTCFFFLLLSIICSIRIPISNNVCTICWSTSAWKGDTIQGTTKYWPKCIGRWWFYAWLHEHFGHDIFNVWSHDEIKMVWYVHIQFWSWTAIDYSSIHSIHSHMSICSVASIVLFLY